MQNHKVCYQETQILADIQNQVGDDSRSILLTEPIRFGLPGAITNSWFRREKNPPTRQLRKDPKKFASRKRVEKTKLAHRIFLIGKSADKDRGGILPHGSGLPCLLFPGLGCRDFFRRQCQHNQRQTIKNHVDSNEKANYPQSRKGPFLPNGNSQPQVDQTMDE